MLKTLLIIVVLMIDLKTNECCKINHDKLLDVVIILNVNLKAQYYTLRAPSSRYNK